MDPPEIGLALEWERLPDSSVVVAIVGEADAYDRRLLADTLEDVAADESVMQVTIDLRRATYVDSTLLGVLLQALKRLRSRDAELVVVCSDPEIRRPFELTGLDRVFRIVRDVPANDDWFAAAEDDDAA
jgi:anti-sigma B factor antagonist